MEEVIMGWLHRFSPHTLSRDEESGQQVELWIAQMEGIFQAFSYVDQQKVEFTTHHLRGPAWNWWQRIQANKTQQEKTWGHFVELFREEYVSLRVVKEQEDLLPNTICCLPFERNCLELVAEDSGKQNPAGKDVETFCGGILSGIRDTKG
jgi:hypothetical protein